MLSTNSSEILKYQLGGFGLPRARLAADDDALVLAVAAHVRVRIVADREDVRRQLADLALFVQLDLVRSVDRQDLVRVHRH